jgi:HlyD family secretion protein
MLAAGVLLLAVLGWASLGKTEDGPRYVTAEVRRGDLNEAITANGVLNPTSVINVGTQVSGTVMELKADFNDRVVAGQVLLRLDPAIFASQLAASEAQLAVAEAQAALQRANLARGAQLVEREFISKEQHQTLIANSLAADAQVRQAAARVAQDRANLAFSVIRAPVAGVIISREVDVGQTVAAAFSTPVLFRIARDLGKMQIEASVAEADIARISPGQQVLFTVDAYGRRRFEGRVSQIRLNPVTQQNVVTYIVIVEAPNPDGALLPGMTADARFQVETKQGVLLLPNGALGFRPEGWQPLKGLGEDEAVVFVAGGTAERPEWQARRVRLGANDSRYTEVVGGALTPGERVITALAKVETGGGIFNGPPGGRRESGGGGRGLEEENAP